MTLRDEIINIMRQHTDADSKVDDLEAFTIRKMAEASATSYEFALRHLTAHNGKGVANFIKT